MLVVADSSPLIALAIIDGLPLLDALYRNVRVPKAVFDEENGHELYRNTEHTE